MNKKTAVKSWLLAILLTILGGGMSACAMGGGSWKEEVLLHDGTKIVVERSQSYGGRHEMGQEPPIKEENITFVLPNTHQSLTWTSEYSEDVGRANFEPLALHILNGMPYIVATPNLCLAYNKWGRPNPPYVIFKHTGKTWQRIPLADFPSELREINLVINTTKHDSKVARQSLISAETVRKLNSTLTQPEYKTILRKPLPESELCPDYSSPRYMIPKAPNPIVPNGGSGAK